MTPLCWAGIAALTFALWLLALEVSSRWPDPQSDVRLSTYSDVLVLDLPETR